jgi:hypothetical protein
MCPRQCIVLCIIAFEKFPSGQYGMVNGETYHVPYRLPHSLQNNKLFLVTQMLMTPFLAFTCWLETPIWKFLKNEEAIHLH